MRWNLYFIFYFNFKILSQLFSLYQTELNDNIVHLKKYNVVDQYLRCINKKIKNKLIHFFN